MKQDITNGTSASVPVNVLLADDDSDDRHFFQKILIAIPVPTMLVTVEDGEKLMTYLLKNSGKLPDVLFLDINMPRKNGAECLVEIKQNDKLKHLPVIIYSTSLYKEVADRLYNNGAHYYFRKTDLTALQEIIRTVLNMIVEKKFDRPGRDKFILGLTSS